MRLFLLVTAVLVVSGDDRVYLRQCCDPMHQLTQSGPQCTYDYNWRSLPDSVTGGRPIIPGFPECDVGETLATATVTDLVVIDADGSLQYGPPHHAVTLQKGQFCVDGAVNVSDWVVWGCVRDPCANETCVSRCCFGDEEECLHADDDWEPTFHKRGWANMKEVNVENYRVRLHDFDSCIHYKLDPSTDASDAFYLLTTGELYVPAHEGYTHTIDSYCIHQEISNSSGKLHDVVYVCFDDPLGEEDGDSAPDSFEDRVYPVAMLISCVFLLVTFGVYVSFDELRNNIQGKLLLCYVASMFCAFLTLSMIQLVHHTLYESRSACRTMAVVCHFFFMTMFFWMNTISFHIWRTLRFVEINSNSHSHHSRKTLFIYSLYAWGSSLVVSFITIIMDFSPGIPHLFIKPLFGYTKCWFSTRSAVFLYFLGPVSLLLVANIVFFALTARKISRMYAEQRNNIPTIQPPSKKHSPFKMGLKLFLIMGITWILEVMSWLIEAPANVWYIFDAINSLHGVFVFVLLVCNKRVLELLRSRKVLPAARGGRAVAESYVHTECMEMEGK